jgi:hypothetical protein
MKIKINSTEDAYAGALALALTASSIDETLQYLSDAKTTRRLLNEPAIKRAKIRAIDFAMEWWDVKSEYALWRKCRD